MTKYLLDRKFFDSDRVEIQLKEDLSPQYKIII